MIPTPYCTKTAAAWVANGGRNGHSEPYYLATFAGYAKVGYFRADWWAVCPEENGGMGLSFCCGPETRLVSEAELLATFGTMATADECIQECGGHAHLLKNGGRGQ